MSAQSLQALELANTVRFGHADIRRELAGLGYRESRRRAAEILEAYPESVQTMRVDRLLHAIHRFGPHHSARLLADAWVQVAVLSRPLNCLTDRQRLAIARVLRERAGELEGQPASPGLREGA